MFYLSGYSHIRKYVAVLFVILALLLQPFHFALADSHDAEPDPVAQEETISAQDPEPTPDPEPQFVDGEDGEGGGDGIGGADGTSVDDPPAPGADPLPGEEGDGTDPGENPPDEEPPAETPTGDTTVDTGDATSEGTIKNTIDVNELKVYLDELYSKYNLPLGYVIYDHETGKYIAYTPEAQEKLDEALEDGLVDPYEFLDIVTPELDVTASTTNETVLENEAEIEATTGGNTANNNDNVTINTGDAKASANVLNIVNTNIYNSEGFFLFLDNLSDGGISGSLDLREYDFFNPSAVQESTNQRTSAIEQNSVLKKIADKVRAICPSCGGNGDLTINTDQVAEITNDIVVRSGTGINETSGGSGDASINTGDAYAAANVINLANTNIVDSNYLLLTFNNYGDWDGDLVFPSADALVETFSMGGQSTPAVIANNDNTVDVNNNADLTAGTGDNIANGGGNGGTITTGDANASTNVLNELNSNLIGGTSFSILIKVHGDWSGDIVGAPEGMEWRETPNGIEIYYDPEGSGTGTGSFDSINVNNNNTATINNNIEVIALTGENKIEGAGGDTSITTGDAHAAANIINVANTNVVGKNWLMAVVNIFGDWNGNLTFGLPNLWIGAKVVFDSPNPGAGTGLTYQYTVMNTGDAPSNNVCLRNRFDSRYLELTVQNPATDREVHSGEVEYCIGTVEAGAVREIERRGRIAGNLPYGTTFISNNIEVIGSQGEEFLDDNEEIVSFDVWNEPPQHAATGGGGTSVQYKPSPDLKITKSHSSPFGARASSTVTYHITVRNVGPGSAYDTVLTDTLTDEDGNNVYVETWNLGEIYSNETIEVEYTTFFNDASEPGWYSNSAQVKGLGGHHTFLYGRNAKSNTAESEVLILPAVEVYSDEEEVLVIPESVDISEGVPADEVILEIPEITHFPVRHLAALHGPSFTQHPVHLDGTTGEGPLFHPTFTQHPVYLEFSKAKSAQGAASGFLANIFGKIAESSVLRLITLPFDTLSRISIPNYIKESSADSDEIVALLAMSIFAMRRNHYKKKEEEMLL